ncbi:MAG: DUF5723 family protein [Bacteroidales bacterium]
MKKHIAISIIAFMTFILAGNNSYAQYSDILNTLREVPQGNQMNPSRLSNYRWAMGIPVLSSIQMGYNNQSLRYTGLFKTNENGDLVIRKQSFLNNLDKKAGIALHQKIEILRAQVRYDKHQFTFGVSLNNTQSLFLSEGIFHLALEGNAPYIGKDLNLLDNNSKLDVTSYMEYALGYSTSVNDKLRVGGRLKYLVGIANMHSVRTNASLYTAEDDYSLRLRTDILAYSSYSRKDPNGTEFGNFSVGDCFKNNGFAIDLGASYKLNDKIDLGLSILDWGFISWGLDPVMHKSKKDNAQYIFNGFDMEEIIIDNKFNAETVDDFLESLTDELEVTDTLTSAYTTHIPTRFALDGSYKFNEKHSLYSYWNSTIYDNSSFHSFSVNYKFNYKFLGVAVGNTINSNHFFNPGVGLYVNGGCFQFYCVIDHMNSTYLSNVRNVNATIGFNLVFD